MVRRSSSSPLSHPNTVRPRLWFFTSHRHVIRCRCNNKGKLHIVGCVDVICEIKDDTHTGRVMIIPIIAHTADDDTETRMKDIFFYSYSKWRKKQ